MTFTISTQFYPTHTGERPMSYAVWLHRRFLRKHFCCYCWNYETAVRIIELIKETL